MDDRPEEMVRGSLRSEIKKKFPNRDRRGCPEQSVLKEMAQEPDLHVERFYHVLQCGACVEDYERYQAVYRRKRVLRSGLLLAAGLLLMVTLFWYVGGRFREPQGEKVDRQIATTPSTSLPPHATASAAVEENSKVPSSQQVASSQRPTDEGQKPLLPVVHYLLLSPTRGSASQPSRPKTLTLEREPLRLRIHLPVGSEEGTYEVRLHHKGDKKEVLRRKINASKSNHYTLDVQEDFARFPAGSYLLAVFPPEFEGEIAGYPVELVDGK